MITTFDTWTPSDNQDKSVGLQSLGQLSTLTGPKSQLMSRLESAGLDLASENVTCYSNCSARGQCFDGVCFCQVEYSGLSCDSLNLRYYIAFSTVFYAICAVSIVQLVLCINSEYVRQKPRSVARAFRITNQKALYFLICIATALRGFYFSISLDNPGQDVSFKWSASLMSAYYPVLMSCSSLVVCFWAESFHLQDVSPESPGFLSKSFTGFILFNVVTYSLYLAELFLLQFTDSTDIQKNLFLSVFNGIYAFLLLTCIVFFLIYGVEVYFKMKGAFIQDEHCSAEPSQLHQSRLGLVSQAILLLVTCMFLISDVLGTYWKDKVPILSRNAHEVSFRVAELGVALWFPCVLWNCMRPDALWVLNPRKILKKVKKVRRHVREHRTNFGETSRESESLVDHDNGQRYNVECFICYDSERCDMGPLIKPCSCKGDVSVVHHDCLKLWLTESNCDPKKLRCKVCDDQYNIERGDVWLPAGLTPVHWFQSACILTIMCSAAGSVVLLTRIFDHVAIRTASVGSAIIVEYICLRFLGANLLSVYNRAKLSAIKINGQPIVRQMSFKSDGQPEQVISDLRLQEITYTKSNCTCEPAIEPNEF
ncbi:hypothetical protein HDE_01489 [Halotydeus destructor]|nr:hypothetical protein HDE_01489 [Halotydeus destructor]